MRERVQKLEDVMIDNDRIIKMVNLYTDESCNSLRGYTETKL